MPYKDPQRALAHGRKRCLERKGPRVYNIPCFTTLTKVVSEVLELPWRERKGEAWEIVNAIFITIRDALLRGEEVRISGFGIFKVREMPAYKGYRYFYPYLRKKGLHSEMWEFPARKKIVFQPSSVLKTLVRESNPEEIEDE